MNTKELLLFADACLAEAKTQAEHHAKLANNYRCIATKTRMLRESIEALEETIHRIGIEKSVSESMRSSDNMRSTHDTPLTRDTPLTHDMRSSAPLTHDMRSSAPLTHDMRSSAPLTHNMRSDDAHLRDVPHSKHKTFAPIKLRPGIFMPPDEDECNSGETGTNLFEPFSFDFAEFDT